MVYIDVVYQTFGNPEEKKIRIKGISTKHALLKMLDNIDMWFVTRNIESKTVEEILKDIDEQNGDGCDYIRSIKIANDSKNLFTAS